MAPDASKAKLKKKKTKEAAKSATKPQEQKSISNTTATAGPSESVMKDTEASKQITGLVDFPRGGSDVLTPLEQRDIQDSVAMELQQESATKNDDGDLIPEKKQPKKRRRADASTQEGSTAAPSAKKLKKSGSSSSITSADLLTFKRLNKGAKLLGAIREINDLDMVISLPDQLNGYVAITEISRAITEAVEAAAGVQDEDGEQRDEELRIPNLRELFHVGQLVPCAVIGLEEQKDKDSKEDTTGDQHSGHKRRIELSLNPDVVNENLEASDLCEGMTLTAVIESEEDHGYTVSFGISGIKGFLNRNHCKEYVMKHNGGKSLAEGQLVICSLMSVNANGRVAAVTADTETVAKAMIPASQALTLKALTPGMQANARVKSVLENGLLLSFQGVFEATVDWFHLGHAVGDVEEDIEKKFKENQKLRARIISIDFARKRIGMTLMPSILSLKPYPFPATAELDIGSKIEVTVKRVDQGTGLLLQSDNGSAYVHISRVADSRISKFDKRHKAGSKHPARVIGFDHLDGLVHVSLQPSVIDQPFMRYDDLKPQMMVKGRIAKLDKFGMIIAITDSIKGLCPTLHMSEVKLTDPKKLFKVGAAIKCQVLSVDPKRRRLILTHKKSLMNSNLPAIASYGDVQPGTIAHGVIAAVKDFGCILNFYNDVKALAHVSELSEEFMQNPREFFKEGQVVKCRVLSSDADNEKMSVSFKLSGGVGKKEDFNTINVGQIVNGKVVTLTADGAIVALDKSPLRGLLPKAHVSDFLSNVEAVFRGLQENVELKNLVIVSKNSKKKQLILSMKSLLVKEAQERRILQSLESVEAGTIIPGYIRTVTDSLCTVSYLGTLRGVAKVHNVSDLFVAKVSDFVKPGQTVVTVVTEVDKEHNRLNISLKDSACFPAESPNKNVTTGTYLRDLFIEKDHVDLRVISQSDKNLGWSKKIAFGETVEGTVKSIMPYGVIVDLFDGLSGLITTQQMGNEKLEVGTTVKASILDVDLEKRIVDLSVKHAKGFSNTSAKSKKLEANREKPTPLDAIIEVIKEDYLIVALPAIGVIGYVTSRTFNSQDNLFTKYKVGQKIKVSPYQVPKTGSQKEFRGFSSQRLILNLVRQKVDTEVKGKNIDNRRQLKDPVDTRLQTVEDLKPGMKVKAKVKSVKGTQMNVVLAANLNGRVHVTELTDSLESLEDPRHPFKGYHIGDTIETKVVGFHDSRSYKFLPISHRQTLSSLVVELTLRPSDLNSPDHEINLNTRLTFDSVVEGNTYLGYVKEATADALWVYLGHNLLGRAFVLECSDDVSVLQALRKRFAVGRAVKCRVVRKDTEKKTLDVSLKTDADVPYNSLEAFTEGRVVPGRISQINPTGLVVQLGPTVFGRVQLTDIADVYKTEPTKAFQKGQIVSCYVLALDNGSQHVDLSLRASRVSNSESSQASKVVDKEIKAIEDLEEGMLVQCYVKSISNVGVFVSINRTLSARVRIAELSDDYIKDWKAAFQVGQLVKGRILSLDKEDGRIEMSLKKSVVDPDASKKELSLADLEKGQKVSGTITKIERYGVFVQVANSRISGLCHSSELSDEPVEKIDKLYKVGDHVKAIVLDVDKSKKRVAFGLKPSYFSETDAMDVDENDEEEPVTDTVMDDSDDNVKDYDESEAMDEDDENAKEAAPSLRVMDSDPLDLGNLGFSWTPQAADEADELQGSDDSDEENSDEEAADERKESRRAKKRRLKEREEEAARKERMLADGEKEPETADDFERLLLGSPNDSYIWINYMAFQLEMVEIDKARAIAERALKAINFREEQEKLNVWIAWLNLENTYGTSESLKKVFDRAASYNDPKKIHMQLAQIYERTSKTELAEELYKTTVKKFKESCKVWVAAALFYLKHRKAEEARSMLSRSLLSLPKRKHIKITFKFAQLEFKYGEPERGRTIFEGLVSNYPKRVDLWSIYLDMEIRNGDLSITRRLFDRAINLKFSSKKMKFFFKKYLDFEKNHGDEAGVERVKKAALDYVQSLDA
ncbi:hypothetical protein HK102_001993 [Quaeritorhiza haematococci]|nr:hypothetical protein HK102_001993 [Quaeritorhiza haematococci]